MARSFTEREKENIKRSLQEACKQSWTQYGYKKTSVDDLCRQAGISKGAFYLFFESHDEIKKRHIPDNIRIQRFSLLPLKFILTDFL